jgi:hypothetical protein
MAHSLKFKHTFSAFSKLAQLLAHFLRFQQILLIFGTLPHSFSTFDSVSKFFSSFGLLSPLLAYFHNIWPTLSTFGIYSKNSVQYPILLQLFANGLSFWHIKEDNQAPAIINLAWL